MVHPELNKAWGPTLAEKQARTVNIDGFTLKAHMEPYFRLVAEKAMQKAGVTGRSQDADPGVVFYGIENSNAVLTLGLISSNASFFVDLTVTDQETGEENTHSIVKKYAAVDDTPVATVVNWVAGLLTAHL